MKELLKNAEEFIQSAEKDLKDKRYNASVSNFFKAIVILCDYLIYKEIKIIPKNHNQRFNYLQTYFPQIYSNISSLFKTYTDSYNLRLNQTDAIKLKNYANELKSFVTS